MLLEALELANEGRKPEARKLLEAVLRLDNTNETAWLWLADCCDSVQERQRALEACLQHNPDSQRARAALTWLHVTARAADRQRGIPLTGGQTTAANDAPTVPSANMNSWRLDEGAGIFTVSPDALTPEEFAAVEARAENSIQHRPSLRSLLAQRARRDQADDWNELSAVGGRRAARPRRDRTQPLPRPQEKSLAQRIATAAALFVFLTVVLTVGALLLLRAV